MDQAISCLAHQEAWRYGWMIWGAADLEKSLMTGFSLLAGRQIESTQTIVHMGRSLRAASVLCQGLIVTYITFRGMKSVLFDVLWVMCSEVCAYSRVF